MFGNIFPIFDRRKEAGTIWLNCGISNGRKCRPHKPQVWHRALQLANDADRSWQWYAETEDLWLLCSGSALRARTNCSGQASKPWVQMYGSWTSLL